MARRSSSIVLLLPVLVLLAACSKETGQAEGPAVASTPSAEALVEPLLALDTTAQALNVTHRPTGVSFQLFEDETFEESEEGTFHRLLSSFGAYVSYSKEWYYEGGAHPSYGQTYHAVTVGETLAEADLRDLFPERALYAALQQTPLVQQTALDHATLDELLDGLATTYACEMSFERFFSSFFVKQVQDDIAEVVVGLTHGCEAQRGNFTTLILTVDVSQEKKAVFEDLQLFHDQTEP